jgi:hypothetical protein
MKNTKKKRNQPTPKQLGLTMYLELARLYPINTVGGKCLLLYYASRCDKYGRFHPGYDTICRETGLSDETVRVYNNKFKDAGVLSWEKGYKNVHMDNGIPNRYQLNPVAMRQVIESSTPNQSGMLLQGSTPDSQGSTPSSTPNQSGGKEHLLKEQVRRNTLKVLPDEYEKNNSAITPVKDRSLNPTPSRCAAPSPAASVPSTEPDLTPRQKLEQEVGAGTGACSKESSQLAAEW